MRSALVVAEVMASVVLLVSAGLLMRALWRMQATDPGFRTDGVLTLQTALPIPKYDETARRAGFYTEVLSGGAGSAGRSNAAYISFPAHDHARRDLAGRGGWPSSRTADALARITPACASSRRDFSPRWGFRFSAGAT